VNFSIGELDGKDGAEGDDGVVAGHNFEWARWILGNGKLRLALSKLNDAGVG